MVDVGELRYKVEGVEGIAGEWVTLFPVGRPSRTAVFGRIIL